MHEEEFHQKGISREEKWIQKWKESHTFEPNVDTRKKKFFFTVPWAYPTGPLHVGHGRTYTNGDVIARFRRIKGENVCWPMGFHVTGTPVLAISDSIKRKDPEMLKLYREYLAIYETDHQKIEHILESLEDPTNVASYFSAHLAQDLDRIGASIDWRAKFTSMDPDYQKFIGWQFGKLKEKGALVKGKYPILFSILDKNAVGEDDIKDGDTDKVAIQTFELIKFPFGKSFIVASTLRPETLYGVTNIWINPKNEYVRVLVNGEEWIVAKNAVEKLGQQSKNVKIVSDIPASELIGKEAQHPILHDQKIPILETSFISAEKGTGVVYSVPGHAPWDYAALKDRQEKGDLVAQKIQPKMVIDNPDNSTIFTLLTKFKNPTLAQRDSLQMATEEIYKKEFYEGKMNAQNGPLSGMPVQKAKDKMIEALKTSQRHDLLYEPSRRSLTRAGNPVSVAVLDDQWFLDYSSPEWKKKTREHVEKMPIYPEKFKRNILDAIEWLEKRPCIRKRGLGTPFPFAQEWMIEPLSDSTIYMVYYIAVAHVRAAKLSMDQLDESFFDAAMLGKRLPGNDPRSTVAETIFSDVSYWYPNDQRHTAPAHISNHISFFIFTHTLLFPSEFWPKNVTFNEMLVRNGVKMSKSKGNVIPLQHAVRDYGADLMRLYIVSSAGFERVADWKDNQVPQVRSKLVELERMFVEAIGCNVGDTSEEGNWLEQNLRAKLGEAFDAYDRMDFMVAAQKAFFETLNEVKRYKKVFGGDERPIVKRLLREWLILISPITPFLAEEMGEHARFTEFVSIQTLERPHGTPSPAIETRVAFIENVLQDMERVKKLVKGGTRKTAYVYSADDQDTKWLGESMKQLEKFTQMQVKINDAHDPLGKKAKATKGRPSLFFE